MSNQTFHDIEVCDYPDVILESDRLIKVRSKAKRPVNSTKGPYYSLEDDDLINHYRNGGNLGLVLDDSDDLLVLDSDSIKFRNYVEDMLPETLTVESGSGGNHFYFRSEFSDNRVLTDSGKELGSIRTDNWMVVLPPSIHPNGESYKWLNSSRAATLESGELESLIAEFTDSEISQHRPAGSGSRSAAAAARCWSDLDLRNYPNRDLEWSQIKLGLERKGTLRLLSRTASNDWSGLEFTLAKSMSELGLSESSMKSVMNRLSSSSKWHRRGESYRSRTLFKALQCCIEETENPKNNYQNYLNIMEYETTDTQLVYQAESTDDVEDGDRAIKIDIVRMTGTGDDGEDVDVNFLSLNKGRFRDNGEFGMQPEFNGNSKSIGAADETDMKLIAECLEELSE